MNFYISVVLVVTSLSFLILFIWTLSLFYLMHLSKCSSILFIFLKKQLLASLIFSIVFFLMFYIFIGVQLLYTAVSVSAIQQSESAIRIHISPLFWISLPFRSPQDTQQSSLCYTVGSHQLPILYLVGYICQSQCANSSHHPLPSWYSIHSFSTTVSLFLLCK